MAGGRRERAGGCGECLKTLAGTTESLANPARLQSRSFLLAAIGVVAWSEILLSPLFALEARLRAEPACAGSARHSHAPEHIMRYIRYKRRWEWSDQSTYVWSIRDASPKVQEFFDEAIAMIAAPATFFGAFWLLSQWLPRVAFWLAALACVSAAVVVAVRFVNLWRIDDKRIVPPELREDFLAILAGLGGATFMFWSSPSWAQEHFQGAGAAATDWLLFVADQLSDVLLLGIPENVFGYRLSAIVPTDETGRGIVVAMRIFVSIGVLDTILRLYRREFGQLRIEGTVQDCYRACNAIRDSSVADKMRVRCVGRIIKQTRQRSFSPREFCELYDADANRVESSKAPRRTCS
jgi:hypothetical protein